MDRYYSTLDVAKICHVSRGSVIRWIHEGKLPAAVTAGGHHRISGEDFRELLTSLRMKMPAGLKSRVKISRRPAVLIVEEDPAVRKSLRSFLKDFFPRLRVEEAAEGFKAGVLARNLKPDLILLDLHLFGELQKILFKYFGLKDLRNEDLRKKRGVNREK